MFGEFLESSKHILEYLIIRALDGDPISIALLAA